MWRACTRLDRFSAANEKVRATLACSSGAKHLYSQRVHRRPSLSSPGATPLRRAPVSVETPEQPKNKKEGGANKDQRKGTRILHFHRAGGSRPPSSWSHATGEPRGLLGNQSVHNRRGGEERGGEGQRQEVRLKWQGKCPAPALC